MKILLLNDNPVVRKLVALSAQKTKDDLSVIWSVDEVEESAYDLLIVDDAHYSDESMNALKEKITYKTSLLMATRGNTIPDGFDKIINKPFLPTDLVDLFAKIDNDLGSSIQEAPTQTAKAIVLDDSAEKDFVEGFDITNLDDDLNLDDFDIEDDESVMGVKTNVLDHEEVQELQDLLDDTDGLELDDELSLDGLELDDEMTDLNDSKDDDLLINSLEDEGPSGSIENEMDDAIEDFDFDEDLLAHEEETEKPTQEALGDEEILGSLDDLAELDNESEVVPEVDSVLDEELDDLMDFDEETLADEDAVVEEETRTPSEEAVSGDELEDLDALLLDGLSDIDEEDEALSDDEFGELEQQIQEAVEDLGIEDLAKGFDESELGDLNGLGDLDGLSEREIKLAIGEEVDEEDPDIRIGHGGDHSSLDAEALSEAMEELSGVELDDELENIDMDSEMVNTSAQEHHGTPAEGIDALQALLKALSNEEVSKTLKGLSINININFGNEK